MVLKPSVFSPATAQLLPAGDANEIVPAPNERDRDPIVPKLCQIPAFSFDWG